MGKEAIRGSYRFLEQKKEKRLILKASRVLGICRSGYYAWKKRPLSRRAKEDILLTRKILEIYRQSKGVYGAPRIWAELRLSHGVRCSRTRVRRAAGIASVRAKRRVGVTRRGKGGVFPDLVNRYFEVEAPDRLWVADLTQHPTDEGWVYLAVVIDAFSRMVVSWSIGQRPTEGLVVDALNMAIARRRPLDGLIHRSDQGIQYFSLGFSQRFRETGILGSMGTKGDALDNALAESFYATLQTERLDRRRFRSREELRLAIFEYIETFYNRQRRHSALGYLSPEEFEKKRLQNQEKR